MSNAVDRVPSSLVQLSAPTLADQAYGALRDAIIAGELARGEKITERGLAERLRVSPTPVREALRRLEQDRLVERTGPRSIRVASFTDTDLAEVSAIEDTLRGLAARLAATNATKEHLAAILAELEAAEAVHDRIRSRKSPSKRVTASAADRIFEHFRRFHRTLDRASNSPLLLHLLQVVEAFDVNHRRETLHRQLAEGGEEMESRFGQHREIYEAVAAGDEDLAELLMLRHCRESTPGQLETRRETEIQTPR